jgi:hypothetical protein
MSSPSDIKPRSLMRDTKQRKYLPPFAGSPFGEFPPDFVMPNQKHDALLAKKPAKPAPAAAAPAKAHAFLASHSGNGGLCASTAKGTVAPTPAKPVAGAFGRRKIVPTEFRRFYDRGDLPVTIQHRGNGRKLDWKVDIEKLDFHHYLPIFFDGLREKEEPYNFLAYQGCYDLLLKGGSKILPTIPQLIIPLKTALNSRDGEIVCAVLKVIQKLVTSGELIGEALVPYYRQLLPVFCMFKTNNHNLGDAIDYSQRKRQNLGDLVHETLQMLEAHGGEDAFINIKYMVPTYESCVLN